MRKVVAIPVLVVAVIAVALAISWVVMGERVVRLIDQYRTGEVRSAAVRYVHYIGDGTGGALWMNIGEKELTLFNLTPADASMPAPHVGTTPKNELAISFAGKVFVCGAIPTDSPLAMNIPGDDEATLITRRGLIGWPSWFERGAAKHWTRSWKRNWYYDLSWKHASGAELRMHWRSPHTQGDGPLPEPATDSARLTAVEVIGASSR